MSAVVAMLFIGAFAQKPAQTQQQKPQKKIETTVATENATPAKPVIPAGNNVKQQDNSNKTIVNIKSRRMFPIQLGDSTVHAFVGNVVAYHNNTIMQCDSAVRYNENKIECFKNVLINKDSIYVYGDRLVYNRLTSTAEVFSPLIKMIDGSAILYTYNFRYNTLDNIGTFLGGGTMHKGKEMLFESERGYYFGNTREAVGVGDVELRDSLYLIKSDSLGFNMDSEIATFYKQSTIWNNKEEILSANSGWYDTRTDHYHFMSNAYVLSADQEIWADDIDFRGTNENAILKRDIQIYDKEQSVYAFGDYGTYIGEKGDAMLTENPSVINIAEARDSVFMRADSIFLYVIDSTSIYSQEYIDKNKAKAVSENSDEQLVSGNTPKIPDDKTIGEGSSNPLGENTMTDGLNETQNNETSGVTETDSAKLDTTQTVTNQENLSKSQVKKLEKEARRKEKQLQKETRDSIRTAERQLKQPSDDGMKEGVVGDTITETIIDEIVSDGTLSETIITEDTTIVTDSLSSDKEVSDSTSVVTPKKEEEKERVTVGYYNVKIFRDDLQAVCDSLVAFSRDSTAHLHRNPVVWNGDNQIKSDLTVVYTKNQQLDKAIFTGGEKNGNPVMSSEIDKTHYNQITGKVIEALFRENDIYKTNVNGNAETLYYMQEDDGGALQGFMVMACSDMTFLIINQEIDEIVFKGTPDWAIYPMNLIPPSQPQKLPNFVWEADRRPVKKDVFDRTIRPSQREKYELLPKPVFPLTTSINDFRQSIIKSGLWKDRDDEVTLDAIEYVQRLLSQGQVELSKTTK